MNKELENILSRELWKMFLFRRWITIVIVILPFMIMFSFLLFGDLYLLVSGILNDKNHLMTDNLFALELFLFLSFLSLFVILYYGQILTNPILKNLSKEKKIVWIKLVNNHHN